ncbi:transposase [Streptomyces sp. NPDC047017]|uniref:transposase n=1 Tax=Streptomyces sp. NPDC047017 TaxID=3155024 RepID=UPI0033DB55C5
MSRLLRLHLLRNSFRCAARQDRDKATRLIESGCAAPAAAAALDRFAQFADVRGRKYPAVVKLRENARAEFAPLLRFGTGIRRIVCTTMRSSRSTSAFAGWPRTAAVSPTSKPP